MRKPYILADVNVWLATIVEDHPHHQSALLWWQHKVLPPNKVVMFCRITQLGLLRLLTNQTVMGPQRRTTQQAYADYSQLLAQKIVAYTDEPDGLEQQLQSYCDLKRMSRNFWTDAYLAAFASTANMSFVTFDQGFRMFSDLDLQLLN